MELRNKVQLKKQSLEVEQKKIESEKDKEIKADYNFIEQKRERKLSEVRDLEFMNK